MTCVYKYEGKTYDKDDFTEVLLNMNPSEASKYMPGVNSAIEAPFIGKTKSWSLLAFKKMVRYASENGFNTIAWTQGQEQADRYDLSKQVDEIGVENKENGVRHVKVYPVGQPYNSFDVDKDGLIIKHAQWEGKKLDEVVGKEMADKILSSDTDKSFSGLDLKVGGSGMKSFYDKMLPSAVNKFFNKKAWGKAKVGEIEIITKEDKPLSDMIPPKHEKTTLHSLPITPEMRSKALREGMPLFKTAENTETKAFKNWFGKSTAKYESGEPVIFYHGSGEPITIFDKSKSKKQGIPHASSGLGHFFTLDKNIANKYAGDGAGVITEVYLKMEKPYKMSLKEAQSLKTVKQAELRQKALKRKGYDSIIMNLGKGVEPHVIVFESNQAKSPKNVGTFDINNPDIRFQVAPDKKTPEFREWFGGSKVVDEDGEPLVVYHGTKEVFNEFRSKYSDNLFFFTPDPNFAERWAKGKQKETPRNFKWTKKQEQENEKYWAEYLELPEGTEKEAMFDNRPPGKFEIKDDADSAIMPVYLSIQKPFIPHRDFLIVKDLIDESIHYRAKNGAWIAYENKKIIDRLRRLGFDGIYLKEGDSYQKPSGVGDYSTVAAFNPNQVKLTTNQNPTKASKDIRYQTAEDLLKERTNTTNQTSEDISSEPFVVEDNSSLADDFKYNIVDMLAPVSKVYKAIKKKIPEFADFRLAERLRVSKAKEDIEEANVQYFEPIKKIIGEAGLTVENVDEYLYARHAPEANARLRLTNARHYLNQLSQAQKGATLKTKIDNMDKAFDAMNVPSNEIQGAYQVLLEQELKKAETNKELNVKAQWDAFKQKPSGMTDKEAGTLNKKWFDNKAMNEIASLFDTMNNESLKISYESGRITEEQYEAMKGTFDYYAPLYREGFEKKRAFAGIGGGVTSLGTEYKTRGGSTKRAVHILANAITNHEKTIITAKKAEVARAFLEFVKLNPNKNFWDFEETKTVPSYDAHGNIKRVPAQAVLDNEVKIKVDGETHIISANPKNVHAMRILDIIQGNQHNSGPIVSVLSRINRILAAVNTTWNPEFVLSNFSRDVQTAAANLTDTEIADRKKQVFKNLPKAMKGLHSLMRGDGSHEWAKIAKQYQKSGAKIGWIDYGRDIETKAKKLESQIDLFREGHITKKTITKLVSFVEDYNSIVENAVRLATFKTGIDSGMTEAKAALMAKELTVNFNQKGAMGPVINSLYLFANAGIQGSTRIFRMFKNNPKAAAKIVGSIVTTSAAVALANSVIGGDDEDGVSYYDQIDDHLKARNLIFMIPGSKGKFIKIPAPWGYNVFWALGTEVGDSFVKDDYEPLEGMTRMVSTALDAFNPLQSSTILQTLSPTLGDPFVMVGENKTFYGSPLMPERNTFEKVPTPDSERYWSTVRTPSKLIARGLNKATFGNKIKPGAIDVSPETIDLVWDTFTGGAGRFVADTLVLPINIATGDIKIKRTPGIRRILGSKSEYKTRSDYRDNKEHLYTLEKEVKEYPKNRKKVMRDRTYRLLPLLKNTEKRLRVLRKLKKKAKTQSAKNRIQKRIETIEKKFNKRFIKIRSKS